MSSSTGPARPQNSAASTSQQQQQQLQRIGINICVNHPIGAPQFAAISSITETENDDDNNNNNNNNKPETARQNALLNDQSTSLFTAFPHDRGTFDGLILNRSVTTNNDSASKIAQQQRVQCFSTWASSNSYKAFFSLSTTEKNEISDGDDLDDDDDDDDEDGSDDDGNQENSKNNNAGSRQPKRRPRGGAGRKKNHFAFKRVPEKLAEAWFVLSPATLENGNQNQNNSQEENKNEPVVTSYDMLPLLEVFSCQRKAYNEAEKHRGDKKTVPKLTVNIPLGQLTLSQKYTKDFFKKKF